MTNIEKSEERIRMESYVDDLVDKSRKAQKIASDFSQERVDELVGAIAYHMTREDVRKELAEFAYEDTRLGDYESKVGKIETKIKGIYRDIKDKKSVGLIEELPERGLLRYGKPVGVVAAITPSTQPEMLPINQVLFSVKARDSIIFAPHPRGFKTVVKVVEMMRTILKAYDAPEDLILCVNTPNEEMCGIVMSKCDLVVATGGAGMVKAAYSSGTPAYGVGAGNANLIVDESADIKDAARKTMESKTTDLAAGCSCDNSLMILESVYDDMIDALKQEGGYMCTPDEKERIQSALFPNWPEDHVINRQIVASPARKIADAAGIEIPENTKFIMVEEEGSGPMHPLSGEKMTVILTVYKSKDIDDAIDRINANHAYSGAGHSCGIHSFNEENINKVAMKTKTTRVNVNLANGLSNTGNWNVGYPFSGSLGCGTWGGNIASENITLKHYMNNTWVARPIEPVIPKDEELFDTVDRDNFVFNPGRSKNNTR